MVQANIHYEQEAAFNKYIRMTICSYLNIKDALKMKNLSSKERLNFENSVIARDERVLKIKEFFNFAFYDEAFKKMID